MKNTLITSLVLHLLVSSFAGYLFYRIKQAEKVNQAQGQVSLITVAIFNSLPEETREAMISQINNLVKNDKQR